MTEYVTTYTGRFPIFSPTPEDVCVEDIAHQLARQCRYNGATEPFYSVAEHSVFIALSTPLPHRLAALMHDASETYLGDMVRPLKHLPEMKFFRDLEAKIDAVVAKKFGFDYPHHPIIKKLDSQIIHDERGQFLKYQDWSDEDCERWGVASEALGVTLRGWPPEHAEAAFLEVYYTLAEKVHRV